MDNSCCDLLFPTVADKAVVACFDGGDITSDAGLLLLREADGKIGLTQALAAAIEDPRQQSKVRHSLLLLLRERLFALAAGYPDANDLDTLRDDPALKLACEQRPGKKNALASQPTLSRLENAVSKKDLVRIGYQLAERVLGQLPADTKEVTLDVDATDDPAHGQQEFVRFNAYYDTHCYVPLYLYVTGSDGRQRLLCALLRAGNASASVGLFGLLKRAVKLLRARFPGLKILLRADSGFGNASVIGFCRKHDLDFLLGLGRNPPLQTLGTPVQMDCALKYGWEGEGCREYGEFAYKAGTWQKKERVIIKAEITRGELNPRYVVTSDTEATSEQVYLHYCERGDPENRIKEMKLGLESGRTSCHRFLANQFRLLLSAGACLLTSVLQEALVGTRWAKAQVGTLRLRLLKVGARIVETCRKVWLHLPTSFPEQALWHHLYRKLSVAVT